MKLKTVMLLVVLGVASSQIAIAQCGSVAKKTSFGAQPFENYGAIRLASYTGAGFQSDDEWGEQGPEALVGLWKVSFVDAKMNFSDTSYVTYHSDFTEFQNSERTPSTGAVCQGVWKKTGRSTYKVNHYALGYGDNVNLTNVIRIREFITVDRSRNSFTGEFIQDVYDTAHNFIVEFKGPITGKRVTIDSDIDSQ